MELAGKILIAMPGMGDARFSRSVIFLCSHGEDGAMGLVINKPEEKVSFSDLLDHLDIASEGTLPDIRIRKGGPVERGRGFVLHSDDWQDEDETGMEVAGGLRLSVSLGILEALAKGEGPKHALLTLGYSGWGPGQLENEILQNSWLVGEALWSTIFEIGDDEKYASALRGMGIDPVTLSAAAGRA